MPARPVNIGWSSLTSVNNDATLKKDHAFRTKFDEFMIKVAAQLNTMPMVKRLGEITYRNTMRLTNDLMLYPQIPPNADIKLGAASSGVSAQQTASAAAASKPDLSKMDPEQLKMAQVLSLNTDFKVDDTKLQMMKELVAGVEATVPSSIPQDQKLPLILKLGTIEGTDDESVAALKTVRKLLNIRDAKLPTPEAMTQLREVAETLRSKCYTDPDACFNEWLQKEEAAAQVLSSQGGGTWGAWTEGGASKKKKKTNAKKVKRVRGGSMMTWEDISKHVDDRIRAETAPSLRKNATLCDAYRLTMARNLLVSRLGHAGPGEMEIVEDAIGMLVKRPFPLLRDRDDHFVDIVRKSYQTNVTALAVTSATQGFPTSPDREIAVKILQLDVNMGTKSQAVTMKQPLLWLGDVSGNLIASIETAWAAIENNDRSVALEQYMVGRVCQYLAESWTYDPINKKFVSQRASFPQSFIGGDIGARSFQVFQDLYGNRNMDYLANTTKPFDDIAKSIRRAVRKSGGLFALDITQGKKAVARVVQVAPRKPGLSELDAARSYLRRRGCCGDDEASKRAQAIMAAASDQPGRAPTPAYSLTLEYDRYDVSFAPIVMMIFLFYASGMANQASYPPSKRVLLDAPVITQSMLGSILGGFKAPFPREPVTSPLATFR